MTTTDRTFNDILIDWTDCMLDMMDDHDVKGFVFGFTVDGRRALVIVEDMLTIVPVVDLATDYMPQTFGRFEAYRHHLSSCHATYRQRFPIDPTTLLD